MRLIELKKRAAELEFRKNVLEEGCDEELEKVSSRAAELRSRTEKAGVEVFYPSQERLDELGEKLKGFEPRMLREAMGSRSGPAYETLNERGQLIKRNFENRLEIAKLSLIVARMGAKEKKEAGDAIGKGLPCRLRIDTIGDADKKRLVRFMRRCGIDCAVSGLFKEGEAPADEVIVELPKRKVWVSPDVQEKLESNLERMKAISPRIQLKNAQRHVKEFSAEEEEDFANLQQEYLDLLKEQDELVKGYDEESKLYIKR